MDGDIVIVAELKDKSVKLKREFSHSYDIAIYSVKIDVQNNSCVGNSVIEHTICSELQSRFLK